MRQIPKSTNTSANTIASFLIWLVFTAATALIIANITDISFIVSLQGLIAARLIMILIFPKVGS